MQCAPMTTSSTATESVEVSGWDAEAQFFAEIANLDSNESGESVKLYHRVRSGSLLFVRLLRGEAEEACEKSHPSAYEAQAAEPPDFTGRARIRLVPCQPRAARRAGDRSAVTCI